MRRRIALIVCAVVLAGVSVRAQRGVNELNEAGWKALQDGSADRAAALFAEALTMQPKSAVLRLGAGAAAHAQGKPRDAMTRLQEALAIRPGLTAASHL